MSSTSTHTQPIHGLPALREARMHLATPVKPCIGRVVSTERCTFGKKSAGIVRHVSIDVSGTPLEGAWVAGQSFGVIPPGVDAFGKPHKLRLYSIASPTRGEDGNGKVLATTVKRTIDEHDETHRLFLGVCSNYLCDLSPGDPVTLTGPNGKRFVLPSDHAKHDYLFLATGTGIAPFRGMVRDLLDGGGTSKVTLITGSPYTSDLLYHAELEALARTHANFTYLTAISREPGSGGAKPMYIDGRMTAAADHLTPLLSSERALVYICGIAGMELGAMQAITRMLPAAAREQYLIVTSEAGNPDGWDRKMLHKQVTPTRRMCLEVY